MLKTFIVGILFGIAAAAGALHVFPMVDQYREASIVSVAPNGGNRETFHIKVPTDRIMTGAPGRSASVPEGLEWPDSDLFAGVRTELFKIRNAHDAVVGVAMRNAVGTEDANTIDWVLHLPARGSVLINMEPEAKEGGYRIGRFRDGSREFEPLTGVLTERWVADTSGDEDAPAGRIELIASFVGQLEPLP